MSDSYSESDDDYEPIAVASWGDQARKDAEPTGTEKEEDNITNDWSTLLDPNAKVSETGLGSGGLHRQGKNYRPVDETLILQQRLSGASLKTEEEKKRHKDKNARIKRKIDRYAKELKDRPVSQKSSSSSLSSKKSNSTRFSSSSSKSRPFSTTKKSPFSSSSSTASSASFPTSSASAYITPISQSSSSSSSPSSSSTPTTEKSHNVPLALYRQTAPWDAEYPDDHEGSLPLTEPLVSSSSSSSYQQQSKKKGSVRFSHPLEQPPPTTLHSPRMKKALAPPFTSDTTSGSLSTSSSPKTIASTNDIPTKNASHLAPSITKTSVSRTRSTPPSSALGDSTNPWLNTPLIDEPFWANGTKTNITQKEEEGKDKTNKEDDDNTLVEDVEPQQLQKLDIVAASNWTSGNMLTPSPVTTPTKKRQPPIWEPPESAEWFKTFEPSKIEEDNKDNLGKINNNGVTNYKNNLSSSTSVTNKNDNYQEADAPSPKHQQLKEQVIDKWKSPPTPPTSVKGTKHYQSSVSSPPAAILPRLVSSPPNSTPSSADTVSTQVARSVSSSSTSAADLSPRNTGLQTPPASVNGSVNSTPTRPVVSQPGNWQAASNTSGIPTAPTPSAFSNDGGNMWANSTQTSQQDSISDTLDNSSTSTWNDTSSNDNTWKDASNSWTDDFNNNPSTSSWNEQSNWNNNNDTSNAWGSSASNSSWNSSSYNQQQEQQQTISGASYSSGKTSRFSRPDRPKYSTRQKGPRPANYRPGQPILPPTKVAPPSRLENPVVISINVELGPNKKIPVHIHQFDDPQTLAQQFANEHSIRSPNIVAALYQLFSTQKFQAMKQRGRPM